MNSVDGALSFNASINDVNFRAWLEQSERKVLGFSNTVARESAKIDDSFKRLGQLAAGYFSFQALSGLPEQIIKVRGEFQQLEIAFTTMLRSKSKADAFLKEGVAFAATSPFSLRDIGQGQKQLLAYGFSVNEIIPALKRLGDISAGLGLPLERLTYLYGTTKTQGRLFAQDLNQFVGSGIPLIAQLAKQFGVAEDKVRALVENGKVGFAEVKKAIEGMTSGSGIFAGTLDAQSKSLLGLKEKLGDAYDAVLNEIGKKNEGIIANLLNTATDVVTHYQDIIDILKVGVTVYGSYRAALLLVSTAQRANLIFTQTMALQQGLASLSGTTLTATQLRLAASTSLLSRAQAALNATMLANPYVLVGTALAALVTYVVLFEDETKKLKSSQEILADSGKEAISNFNKQRGEIKTLIGVIRNQNVAESERLIAYEKLKSVAPDVVAGLDFQRAKTVDLTSAVNQYLISLRKKIQLESGQNKAKEAYDQQTEAAEKLKKAEDDLIANQGKTGRQQIGMGLTADSPLVLARKNLEAAQKTKREADQVVGQVEQALSNIYAGTNSKAEIEANIARQERLMAGLDKLSFGYKIAEGSLNDYKKQLAELTAGETKVQAVQGKTIEQLGEEIKLKKESLSTANSDAQNAKIRADIDKLEAQHRKLSGVLTAEEKKAARNADKVGPYGSVTYWENIIKKVDTVLGKTPKDNTAEIARQNAIKLNAENQLELARKATALKSFDEELSDKRAKYELYTKWVSAYGQQAADAQFAGLLKSGQSYVDYLNTQIQKLEARGKSGKLDEKSALNLSALIDERDQVTGKKSSIDRFNESLRTAQTEAGSLSQYLIELKKRQDELNKTKPLSKDDFDIRRQLAEETVQVEQQLRQQLDQFLTSYASSGQQQLAIQRDFADKRVALDKQYADKRGAAYLTALGVINTAEKQALQEFQQRKLEETEAYKTTTKVILEEGRKGLKIQIDNQKAVVESARTLFGENSEAFKKAQKELNALQKQFSEGDIAIVNQYASVINQFGQSLISMGGDAAQAGEALVALSSNVGLIADSFKKGIEKSELYSNAIQGVIGLFSAITTAASQRKKAELDYYNAVIAQQQQYNLLLNQQLGTQAKARENIFVKDYTGELTDAFKQFDDAQLKYQESLKKLNQGKAKAGLQGYFDSSTFLKTVGSGAATGAAIGAIGGPAGAAVGAIVGGIVGGIAGFFSSNKKVDEFSSLLNLYPNLIQKTADGVDTLNTSLAQTLIDQGLVDDQTKQLLQSTIDWQKQMDEARQAIKGIVSDLASGLGDKLRDSLVGAFEDGTDAAAAFRDSVSSILEDLVTKMLFSKAFNGLFTQLEADLTKSLNVADGGDGNVIDDFQKFTDNSKGALDLFNQWLQQFQDAAKASGLDVLKPTSGSSASKNPNSVSNAIAGISESTANVLEGQFNAMRIIDADTNAAIRQSLIVLSGIEKNTGRTADNTDYLKSIDKRLQQIANDPTRGIGGTPL
ncbi:tape measure protein [Spirosoma pollinicola]|uniref:Tape measure protein N-terminal domain-containing protein n=1 Tax=Spirosoma pollinicola TaxID=2057025 RepID=A0A2K8YTL7_9BACT|nr:tape measure protein [Spirosoma pollinicola]AUD00929.1 hypothetical protein CWM47_03325 [Spirosoma pollinicola]